MGGYRMGGYRQATNRIEPHQCGQFPQMAYGRLSTATISALRNCIIGL